MGYGERCERHRIEFHKDGVPAVGRYVIENDGRRQVDLCHHCAAILLQRGKLVEVVRGSSVGDIKAEEKRIARALGNDE